MATPSTDLAYLPLLQSFVGVLGAFTAAAFTVWWTSEHTKEREERLAQRAKNAERRKVLREKPEALVEHIEMAFRAVSTATAPVITLSLFLPRAAPLPEGSEDFTSRREIIRDGCIKAAVLADMYFHTLEPYTRSSSCFYEPLRIAMEEASQVRADHVKWAAGPGKDFPTRFAVLLQESIKVRQQILREAKRLIANDFDLKD